MQRIVAPAFAGTGAPPIRELAVQFGLSEKETGNRLVTARRAFQRLLRYEVSVTAASEEDASAEVRDLFDSIGEQ